MTEFRGKVRIATPDDAGAIAALVERCYQGTHPIPECADPAAIARAIVNGSVHYIVATTLDGVHAGQGALKRLGHDLYDHCRVIVDDRCRNQGVLSAMNSFLWTERAPAIGARFVVTEAVTSHLYAQRGGRAAGFIPTGLLIGVFPSAVVPTGIEAPEEPYSALVMARRFERSSRARRLAIVGRDRERALETLDALGVPARRSHDSRQSGAALGFLIERDPHFGIVHLRFAADAPARRLDEGFVAGLDAAGTRILWADVPVETAGAAATIEKLRALGLGHGAYVPLAGPSGEDVVRFQRYLGQHSLRAEATPVLEEAFRLRDEVFAEARALEAVA